MRFQFFLVQWRSAWLRLGSSVDAPPVGQALPLQALRGVGLLPSSVQVAHNELVAHSSPTRRDCEHDVA